MAKTTTTGWKTLDEVAAGFGLTMGDDGRYDTSGLGKNEAKLVNDLYALTQNGAPSVGENYQTYNPAAEQKNILQEKLKKYTGVVSRRYGLSNEGALDNTILKAQRDAAARIDAAMPATAGGGSSGYDLDAEAEAIFEEYYKATGAQPGVSGMMDGEEEIVNDLLGEYQRGMSHEDKWGLSERIYSLAYSGLKSEAAYKMLSEGITALEEKRPDAVDEILAKYQPVLHTAGKDAVLNRIYETYGNLSKEERGRLEQKLDALYKKEGAYGEIKDAIDNGTVEYMESKINELYPLLSDEQKAEIDKYLEEYWKNEDERSAEANEWYEALGGDGVSAEELRAFLDKNPDASDEEINEWYEAHGGDGASIEDLQMLLDKFPNASDQFRLALFDLIEEKERIEAFDEYSEEKTAKEEDETALDEFVKSMGKTKDMTTKDAAAFLEAVDEFLSEDGELDTSKVSQEWWDKNIADKYAEVLEEFGPYFEENDKEHERKLAGEKAIQGEDGKEWYILRSAENDAAAFLEENRGAANDALEKQGYGNLNNPRIPDGVIINVKGARLIHDGDQWRYITNNKNAYKHSVVVNGKAYRLGQEVGALAQKMNGLGTPKKNEAKGNYVYYDGKWYVAS